MSMICFFLPIRGNRSITSGNAANACTEGTPKTRGWQQRANNPVHTVVYNAGRDPANQPRLPTIRSWRLRKPSLHHHTLLHRVSVPFPPCSDPPFLSFPFAPPTLSTFLSVPSPSWPLWRPLRGMCTIRPLPRLLWKGNSTHLQRRGNQSHHKYLSRRFQQVELVQGRRPSHKGDSNRVTHVGGKRTGNGYHFQYQHLQKSHANQSHREGSTQEQPCRAK